MTVSVWGGGVTARAGGAPVVADPANKPPLNLTHATPLVGRGGMDAVGKETVIDAVARYGHEQSAPGNGNITFAEKQDKFFPGQTGANGPAFNTGTA